MFPHNVYIIHTHIDFKDKNEYLDYIPYEEYLLTEHWQKKRRRSLIRGDYRCAHCNQSTDLHVHHETYENLWNEKDEDLTVLCKTCHSRVHEELNVKEVQR